MFYIVQDSAITQVSASIMQNYTSTVLPNITATPTNAIEASSSVYNTLSAMFLFSIPSLPDFPSGVSIIVSFVNWLLLLAEVILILLIIFQDIIGNVNIKLF